MTADLEPKLTMLSIELAASSSADRQYAFLIYADDNLVAVLSQPQHPAARDLRRSWILEAGFGPCGGPGPTAWHDLGEFHQWVLDRCRAAETGSEPHLQRRAAADRKAAKGPGMSMRVMLNATSNLPEKSPAGSALRRRWRNRLRGRVRQPARVVCGCKLVKAELVGSEKVISWYCEVASGTWTYRWWTPLAAKRTPSVRSVAQRRRCRARLQPR